MPHELTIPSDTPASANGHAPPAESPLDRARRVLRGDVRPADYLSVPDDVVPFVDGAEARTGVRLSPHYRQVHIDNLTLQEHYAGEIVLCRHTGEGVVADLALHFEGTPNGMSEYGSVTLTLRTAIG